MTFDALIAVLGCGSPDTSPFARSLLYLDLVLLPDFLHFGALSPLRSHARLGVFALIFDFSHAESLLPMHCLSCSDPTPSILKRGRPGFSIFVPDFLHLEALLPLHSFASPGAFIPALDLVSYLFLVMLDRSLLGFPRLPKSRVRLVLSSPLQGLK
eukprot:s210_g6.t1